MSKITFMKNSLFLYSLLLFFLSSIDEYGFVVSATTKKQGYIRLYIYILNLINSNIPLYSETKAKYSHNKKNTSRYVNKSLKKSIPYRISVIKCHRLRRRCWVWQTCTRSTHTSARSVAPRASTHPHCARTGG